MTFTLTFGWWIAPAIVTIVTFILAHTCSPKLNHYSGVSSTGEAAAAFMILLSFVVAGLVSTIAWLIWSLAS